MLWAMTRMLNDFWARHGGWVMVGAMALVAASTALVVSAARLTHAAPAWWATIDTTDPVTVQTAQDVENAMINVLNERRESDEIDAANGRAGAQWDIEMQSRHASVWLTTRMPAWLASKFQMDEWPDEIGSVQVSFDQPYIKIGAVFRGDRSDRVLSVTLRPELHEDGSLWLSPEWVYIGRLPIPGRWLLARVEGQVDEIMPEAFRGLPESRSIFRKISGELPVAESPVVRLFDGREVRLLALQANEDTLRFTWRTEYE